MKNITVAVPEVVLRTARIRAAERGDRVTRGELHDRDMSDGADYGGVRVENPFREL